MMLAGCWRYMLGVLATLAILVPSAMGGHPELPLDLGTAGDFVILAKTGISTVPSSDITGDMGVSPIDSTAITGFSLIMDISGEFSTSAQVTGKIYASDYLVPTPSKMTTAISDMETAFTQASLRTIPNTTELMAGNISGLTITPGLHKWSTDVLINSDVTLDAQGSADAIFIFQISGDLLVASGQSVLLAAGAQAKNIFWQIEGPVGAVVGTTAHIEGVVLTAKAITIQTGASFNGKLLAQTRVDLDQNILVDSDLIPPEQLVIEIISEHGVADLPVGIYTNDYGTLLTNTVTAMETTLDGGTQYVNTGWSMVGNDPALGTTNTMTMTHTNDAVLTWLWETNYLLNATASPGGSVTGDSNGFYASGTAVTVTAVPNIGNAFIGWTGDFSGSSNAAVQNLTMDQARSLVAHFEVNVVVLEIISEHGIADLEVGLYTNVIGTLLTNTVTDAETLGGTQYVNTGWSMIGNDPAMGTSNTMAMAHTNDAVLTWQWSTNYLLSLSAPNGAITNATAGWQPAGDDIDLFAVPDPGYAFDHWEVNGIGQGSGAPLNVAMDGERNVLAVFTPSMLGVASWNVTWRFDPRQGFYIGTLTIINPSSSSASVDVPFWFKVQSTQWFWLRFPDGVDAISGMHYIDLSVEIRSLLAGIGNGNQVLDPGESVSVGGIELMGRRTPDDLAVDLQYELVPYDSDGTIDSNVYRFWSPVSQGHFYTISEAERDYIMTTWPETWTYESVAWRAHANSAQGSSPVYRFWSPVFSQHFFTISEAERDHIMTMWPEIWTYEGVAWHAYQSGGAGLSPVYRFWSPVNNGHFYTISPVERDQVIATWPDVWTYEGVAYYAYPALTRSVTLSMTRNEADEPLAAIPADTSDPGLDAWQAKAMATLVKPVSEAEAGSSGADALVDLELDGVYFPLFFTNTYVAASVYDPELAAWEHTLAPSWEPDGVFVAGGVTNRHWLVVLTHDAETGIWDITHGSWFGRLPLPAPEDPDVVPAAVPVDMGLPVERFALPAASGALRLLVYDLAEDAYIETISILAGSKQYKWTVPQWNRWYRVDIVREQDGDVIESQWVGHMRTH